MCGLIVPLVVFEFCFGNVLMCGIGFDLIRILGQRFLGHLLGVRVDIFMILAVISVSVIEEKLFVYWSVRICQCNCLDSRCFLFKHFIDCV